MKALHDVLTHKSLHDVLTFETYSVQPQTLRREGAVHLTC